MLRSGHFQRSRARRNGRPRGVHVVEQKHLPGNPRAGPDGERPPDVFVPGGKRQSRLGPVFPGPPQEERVAGPSGEPAQGESHKRGKVVPSPEIFPRPDRNGDDRRPESGREPVGPTSPDRLEEAPRKGARHVASPRVLGGPDPLPDILLVGEKGKGEFKRPVAGAGQGCDRQGPAGSGGGPDSYRVIGEVGRCGRKQRSQKGDFPGNRPVPGLPDRTQTPAGSAGITGRWRGWRVPVVRERWRNCSRFRRRSSGRPT